MKFETRDNLGLPLDFRELRLMFNVHMVTIDGMKFPPDSLLVMAFTWSTDGSGIVWLTTRFRRVSRVFRAHGLLEPLFRPHPGVDRLIARLRRIKR